MYNPESPSLYYFRTYKLAYITKQIISTISQKVNIVEMSFRSFFIEFLL
uniref:Uncharacterized protein n=1 Tax=Anguilla anguilla TaxID=7936 RepID=A0A0E9VKX2_ANGAN